MEVATTPPKKHGCRFLVLHICMVQIPTVEDALLYDRVYKMVDGILDDAGAAPRQVPSKRLAELVERGELFGFWGQRATYLAELDHHWHEQPKQPVVADGTQHHNPA